MNTDVDRLKELERSVEVEEYGPANLNNPTDRVLCAKTITSLLGFLFRRTKLYKGTITEKI